MAWNESGNGRNPWDKGRNEGPPDLDRIVREWQQRLSGWLRGGRGPRGVGPSGSGGSGAGAPGGGVLAAVAGLVVLGWLATGFYRVDDAERGVVLRFGEYVETSQPGLRWHLPWPVERVELINTSEIIPFSQQTRMLTADENIVVVDLVVQYRRADPVKYLFNVRDPEATLRDVSESAIREVVGKSQLDFVLLEGRTEIAVNTEKLIQQTLNEYDAGMLVTKVNLQDANFPSQVEAAVQDAIKAREDRERLSFEAQAYANDIVPRARGEAVRRKEEAEAYKARVVADAQGETARFIQVAEEYRQAPEVTRRRLYLEALEEIYGRSNKIILDAKGSGNLLYLPVDKLLEQQRGGGGTAGAAPRNGAVPESPAASAARERADRRIREGR
jgi:membrane protease subunit HflK